jgi:hypothetical protein
VVEGAPDKVLLRGKTIVSDGKPVGSGKEGGFVRRERGTARTPAG